ncbi:unnamed protein product [Blepharisma stoltei]|uniref:Uncharacterized protein n=1 Tax=Blepharisma stoltei TaxID=1481888 RepID=A0AAU9JI04_9CILI|nr:unnamed protein product [Blepharisma stoltei]
MGISSKELTIAGCAVAISAGVFLYFYTRKKQKGNMLRVEILSKESFIEICQNIRSQYSNNYWPAVKECRIERRRYSPKSENYEQAIVNFQRRTKAFLDSATEQVTRKYGISHKIFENSVNYYDSFPEIAQYSEELVKPAYTEEIKSDLTVNQVRDVMIYYSNRFNELNADYLGDFEDYYIVTSQIEDEIYKKYKIEVEELNNEYEKYKTELEDIVEPMKTQTSYILASADDSFEGYK